jgi:hypothetical protein
MVPSLGNARREREEHGAPPTRAKVVIGKMLPRQPVDMDWRGCLPLKEDPRRE